MLTFIVESTFHLAQACSTPRVFVVIACYQSNPSYLLSTNVRWYVRLKILFFSSFFSSTEVLFCHPHKKSLDLVNLFDSQWGINFAPFTLLPLHIHWSVSIEFSNDSAWMYVYVCVYVWLFALRLADNHG